MNERPPEMPTEPTDASSDHDRDRVPLWRTVQDDLRRRIAAGAFESGVPGELALTEEYGVSRSTIRAALGPLRTEGLIASHPGRRSAVVNVDDEHRFGPVYSLFAAVEQAGMVQRSTVEQSGVRTDAAVAERLGLAPDARLVYIRRTRFADDEVIAVDDTWLPFAIAEPVLRADLRRTALYRVLRDECGVTLSAGRETLHAVATDATEARRLACEVGAAAFFIERLGISGDQAVEWRETLIRGDRFTVTTDYPSA